MKILWLDTETTGLDETVNGIISLAFAVEDNGQFVQNGTILMNPFNFFPEYSKEAQEINGFSREEIESHQDYKYAYAEICFLLDDYVDKFDKTDKFMIGGYNVDFDIRFLRAMWNCFGDKYFGSWFKTVTIDPFKVIGFLQSVGRFPDLPNYKLTTVAEHFGIDTSKAHNAIDDVRMTIKVYRKMVELIKGENNGEKSQERKAER